MPPQNYFWGPLGAQFPEQRTPSPGGFDPAPLSAPVRSRAVEGVADGQQQLEGAVGDGAEERGGQVGHSRKLPKERWMVVP